MKNINQSKKTNRLKGFLIFLFLDLLAFGSYFGFKTLSEINYALINNTPEIIVNEVSFYTFIALFMPVFHLLVILNIHTSLSQQTYKETFNKIYMIFTLGAAIFSGYFISLYIENTLKSADYHFCENLSYEKNVRGATHYVWRNKNTSCNIVLNNPQTQ